MVLKDELTPGSHRELLLDVAATKKKRTCAIAEARQELFFLLVILALSCRRYASGYDSRFSFPFLRRVPASTYVFVVPAECFDVQLTIFARFVEVELLDDATSVSSDGTLALDTMVCKRVASMAQRGG